MDKKHYKIVFGLGADVDKDADGNFILSELDKFYWRQCADWRLKAADFLLKNQMADKIVFVAGLERKFLPNEKILRSTVMKDLLIKNYSVPENLVEAIESKPNTIGNFEAIKEYMDQNSLNPTDCAFMTNFYHIPRALIDADAAGLVIRTIAAESFFVEDEEALKKDYLDLSPRFLSEIKGMRDKELGNYQSKP